MIVAELVYKDKNVPVEVVDVFEARGRKIASVCALSGEPFQEYTHGGWADTATMRVVVEDLRNVRRQEPERPKRKNLLDLALEQARPQWPTGESVWLVPRRVFLKNDDCHVRLYAVGYPRGVEIFWLDLRAGSVAAKPLRGAGLQSLVESGETGRRKARGIMKGQPQPFEDQEDWIALLIEIWPRLSKWQKTKLRLLVVWVKCRYSFDCHRGQLNRLYGTRQGKALALSMLVVLIALVYMAL